MPTSSSICALAERYGARDGGRCLRPRRDRRGGRGTASYFGLEDKVDVLMGTFSKSLASLGGYMAASAKVCEYVRHNSRPFIFSASIPPSACATTLAALRHLKAHPELPQHLLELAPTRARLTRPPGSGSASPRRRSSPSTPTMCIPRCARTRSSMRQACMSTPSCPPPPRRASACCAPASWLPIPKNSSTRPSASWLRSC